MVDGEVYDGDKACKMVLPLQDFNMMRFRISVAMYRGKGKISELILNANNRRLSCAKPTRL